MHCTAVFQTCNETGYGLACVYICSSKVMAACANPAVIDCKLNALFEKATVQIPTVDGEAAEARPVHVCLD